MIPAHLVTLRSRVDQHFADAVARSPQQFRCGPGCDGCCRPFSVFEVEARPIREALALLAQSDPQLRRRIRDQGRRADPEVCALLVDGRCAVYEQRPLICRSHGLPVAVADPGGGVRVDHCPLNFGDGQVPRPSILMLDAINQPLALIAELEAPGQSRVELAQLAADC